MTSLSITLPQTLNEFVEKQAEEGGYSTPSEYVRQPGEDHRKHAEEKLEALILEGLNSGEPIEVNEEFWGKKRRELLERHARRPRKA